MAALARAYRDVADGGGVCVGAGHTHQPTGAAAAAGASPARPDKHAITLLDAITWLRLSYWDAHPDEALAECAPNSRALRGTLRRACIANRAAEVIYSY